MNICKRCIMSDKADPTITFDSDGYCNYCTKALCKINTTTYFPNEEGKRRLDEMLATIKKDGEGKEYDCIMGISGGLDSSYLAFLGCKWGLRILAVHIDDGFDTDISKKNIQKLVNATGMTLKTIIPDAEQYYALTKAYMKAGVPNLAIPQDNILFAFLYDEIKRNHIKYFLTGTNFALECITQTGNSHNPLDVVNIKDIQKKFGTNRIDKLQFISLYQRFIDQKIYGITTLKPLNYIDYNRDRAFKELYDFCGFEYYGRKHLENILTAFVQLYWLPKKFGVDKRSSHLSSMIVSGQMTREEALREYAEPLYDEKQMKEYIEMVKEKLHISDKEFDDIMSGPTHQHADYKIDKIAKKLSNIFLK